MADGFITIKTRIDNSKFDKQISDLEKKISKEEQKGIELKTKMSSQQSALNTETREAQKLEKEYEKVSQKLEYLQRLQSKKDSGGSLSFQQTTDLLDLESTAKAESTLGASLDRVYAKQDKIRAQMSSTSAKYKEISSRVDEYKTKINGINLQKQQADVNKVKDGFKGIGNNIQSVMQRVTRLAIGVIGIRTALSAVRRASSDLAGYDTQYAANLEYIRYVLTQTIAPVLRWIVSLAATLLNYIYAIAGAWFGIGKNSDISAEAFKKMKSNASGVAKSAKEIRKQLAGFDEMNVLGDNTSASSGSGAGGGNMPDFSIGQGEIPDWLQKIIDNKDLILSVFAGVTAGLQAWKLGLSNIQALGIGILVAAIVQLIQDLIDFIKDPTWQGFVDILTDIAMAIGGLMLITGNWWGLLVAVAALIVKLVVDNWDTISKVLGQVGQWIYDHVIKPVGDFFTNLGNGIVNAFNTAVDTITRALSSFGQWVYDNIISPLGKFFSDLWNGFLNAGIDAWHGIENVFGTVANFFSTVFGNAWNEVKNIFSTGGQIFDGIKEGIVSSFKNIVNAIIRGINKVVSIPFNGINNVLRNIRNIDILGAKPFNWIATISVPQIPYLKTGGIVNLPNKGVPVGAMAGESGREGVVPLTDAQAMEELGRAIGRYINLNATIPIYVGNRQIAREMKKINAENDFAYNS